MRDRARAVVIGGGVGGCAILYWLARLGWDDVVLVERAELTSGSTFHSAGLVGVVGELFPTMLERVERGDPGDPQPDDGASYYSFFEPEFVWIDWTKPAADIERQVRAWRFHSLVAGDRGALAELDGETVRVLRVSLEPAEGRAMECGDGTIWIVETEAA